MKNLFSLSTSWNAQGHRKSSDIIAEIEDAGFNTVELSFALSKEMVDDMLRMKNERRISVTSLHNMCPIPEGMERKVANPDYYSMTSLHEDERSLAVETAMTTISYARQFDGAAVVLHTGYVEIRDRLRELAQAYYDRERYKQIKEEMIADRERVKRPYIDNLIKSLEELVPVAKKSGVALAVETRYHHRDIPQIDEFDEIFSHFKQGELYYWHDVGHAEAFDRLGLARHEDYLKRFQNRLIGIHLHDIIGLIHDHNAPGTGTFDFNILKPYVKKDTLLIIEAHKPATAAELRESVALLTGIFG